MLLLLFSDVHFTTTVFMGCKTVTGRWSGWMAVGSGLQPGANLRCLAGCLAGQLAKIFLIPNWKIIILQQKGIRHTTLKKKNKKNIQPIFTGYFTATYIH